MRKAIWLASILITLIFVLIYFYFGKSFVEKSSHEAFKYIDRNNALLFEFQYDENLSELIADAEVYKYALPNEIIEEYKLLDSLIKSSDALIDLFNSKDILAGIQKFNANRLSGFYVINLKDSKPDLEGIFTDVNKSVERANIRMFDALEIYSMGLNNGRQIYYVYDAPFFIMSFEANLIENAIRAYKKSTSIYFDAALKKHFEMQQHESKLARVYLNYQSCTDLLSVNVRDNFIANFNVIKQIGQFSVFDLNYKKDAWILNGEMLSNEKDYFELFKDQTENTSYLNQFLSSNTIAFKDILLSDAQMFRKKLNEYYIKNNNYLYDSELKIFKKRYGITFDQWADAQLGDEYIISQLNNTDFVNNSGSIALLIIKNKEQKNNLSLNTEFKKISTYKERYIYSFPVRNIMYLLLGEMSINKNYQYSLLLDDVLVLATSLEDMKKYIDDYINMDFLMKKNSYQSIKESINESYNFYYYNSIAGSENNLSKLLNANANKKLQQEISIKRFNAFAFTVSNTDGTLINNVFIPISSNDQSEELKEVWSLNLSASASNQAQWLSLGTDQKNFLFIQDDELKLYKIAENSNVEWKIPITEKVISNYRVIDYYKNGESQILFNTANYIYLIKADGTNMPNFPKKLPTSTQLSLSLFDYESDKNYRIFIATQNGSIYGYDISGRPLDGWNPKKLVELYEPLVHKRVQGKDIVFARGQIDFYMLDRKGNVINQFKDSSHIVYNNPFYFRSDNNYGMNRFVSTDLNGKIKSFLLDGRKLYKSVGNWSSEHHFLHADVTGDSLYEYVFIDNDQLFMYSDDTTLGYNFQFNSKISEPPFVLNFDNKNYLGVHSQEASLFYFFNRNAEIFKGFPIKSVNRPAVLNLKGKNMISIISGGGKVVTYQTELKN